jgi:AcrR family transcriptional regulator
MAGANSFYVSESDPPSKREILRSALKLFARHGVVGTNIRAIAAEAGYTNPALFKYFDSKDALALYLFERCYRQCHSVMKSALVHQHSYRSKLRALVREFTEFVDSQPEAFFFVQENLREFWPKISESTRKHSMLGELRKLLQLGRNEGAIDDAVSIEIQLAATAGFFFQLARMNHFGEINPGIVARAGEIEAMIVKMHQR